MLEDWKVVVGTEGHYWVSNYGSVWSCRGKKGQFLTPSLNNVGYYKVGIVYGTTPKLISVHRLVARAFVPGYSPGLVVDHVDGVRNNNICSNLEWVTQKENMRRAWKMKKLKNLWNF